MDCQLSRREMLRFMTFVLPATLFGYHQTDDFDEELVCVHVYNPVQELPSPLLEVHRKIETRNENQRYFQIGLPELVVCETKVALLDMFQYFWPVSRQEITRLKDRIEIRHKIAKIHDLEDLKILEKIFDTQDKNHPSGTVSIAVILTLNEYTQHICQPLVEICKKYEFDELIIFKDPSQPPYLCSYPSRQRGFKKPPPIGGRFKASVVT